MISAYTVIFDLRTLRARGNHTGLPLQNGAPVGADLRVCPHLHVEIIL